MKCEKLIRIKNDVIAFCENDKQYSSIEDVIEDVKNKLGEDYEIEFTNTGSQHNFDTMISFLITYDESLLQSYTLDVELYINNYFEIIDYCINDEW